MVLSLVTRDDHGWTVVSLTGEIDVVTAPRLREHLAAVCESAPRIIVDLTHVDFLDSTGLGVLVGAMKRARSRDRTLRLVCPCPQIRNVLTVTGLAEVLRIHDTLDSAADGTHNPPGDRPPDA